MVGNEIPRRFDTGIEIGMAAINRPEESLSRLGQPLGPGLIRTVRRNAAFILVSLVYLAGAVAVAAVSGQALDFGIYGNVQLAVFLNLAVACIVARILWTLVRQRPARPLRPVWNDLFGDFAIGRRVANALPVMVLLPLVLSAYTSLKTMIPSIAPFHWDEPVAKLDAYLHGGTAPWALLQPVLGEAHVTRWIDLAYGPLWFWMLLVLQFWQTFSLHPQRSRVLVTFVLSWALLGTAMAMTFASAGPVYYSAFVPGPDPFAPLLAYLYTAAETAPVLAVQAQAELWQTYMTGETNLAAGISAMPSMHLSMGMLLVLATWRLGTIVRGLACAYLAVLMLGSVHLAWHYAIDGYASIAGTWAIWWAAGRALERRGRPTRFNIPAPKGE